MSLNPPPSPGSGFRGFRSTIGAGDGGQHGQGAEDHWELGALPGQGLEPHHEARVATNHRCTCCLGLGGLLQLGVGSCGEVGSYQMNQLLQIVFLWI